MSSGLIFLTLARTFIPLELSFFGVQADPPIGGHTA